MAEHAARVRLPFPNSSPTTSDAKVVAWLLVGVVAALVVLALAGLGVVELVNRYA